MYIKLPELSIAGWTLKKETSEHIVYAAPAPYRLLMFIPKSIAAAVSSATVDASIGWHYDRNYVAGAYTLLENVGLKHTKVTIRRVIEYTDEPVATIDKIFAKTPRNDGKRAEGGGRKPAYPPNQRVTTSVTFTAPILERLKCHAQQEGTDVSKIVHAAVTLLLDQKDASRTPDDYCI